MNIGSAQRRPAGLPTRSRGFTLRPNETLDILPSSKATVRVIFPPSVRIRVKKRD